MNETKADLDELVFRAKNKSYGAYNLRKLFPKHSGIAAISGYSFLALLFLIPIVVGAFRGSEAEEDLNAVEEEFEMIDLEEVEEEEIEEEEFEPPPPPERSQVKFVPPEIVEIEEADPEVTVVDVDTVKADLGNMDIEGDPDADPEIGNISDFGDGKKEIKLGPTGGGDPPDEFVFYEKQPQPVNLDELKKAIEYPQIAKDAGISGRVVFRVLIDENGRYKKHKVLKTPSKWLTNACTEHLPKIRFTPGIQAGKPVPAWVTVPFDFKLD